MKNCIFQILLISILSSALYAQTDLQLDSTLLKARVIDDALMIPWSIVWGADDHIWLTERRGRVIRIDPITKSKKTILNIESRIVDSGEGEPGMLGLALHPNFVDTPKVYFVYNYGVAGQIKERLSEWTWTGDTLAFERILLDNLPGGAIHDGSRLLITTDRKILMSTGETGSSNLSQNLSSVNGKILRINLDGTIPSDNPIPGSLVYSFGHRNPQGLCYGANASIIYSSEHGAQQSDEVNIILPIRNYGWPNVQGACNTNSEMTFCNANNVKEPMREWSPCVAVNGMVYYNHPAIPEFGNSIIMAVLGGFVLKPRISVLTLSQDGQQILSERQFIQNLGRIRDLCINPKNGALYIVNNGPSYPGSGPNSLIEYRNMAYNPNGIDFPICLSGIDLMLSPNPSKLDLGFYMECNQTFIGGEYRIYNIVGQPLLSGKINSSIQKIETSHTYLTKGTYIFSIKNNGKIVSKPILIQ